MSSITLLVLSLSSFFGVYIGVKTKNKVVIVNVVVIVIIVVVVVDDGDVYLDRFADSDGFDGRIAASDGWGHEYNEGLRWK